LLSGLKPSPIELYNSEKEKDLLNLRAFLNAKFHLYSDNSSLQRVNHFFKLIDEAVVKISSGKLSKNFYRSFQAEASPHL
jgi:hypothetical protein